MKFYAILLCFFISAVGLSAATRDTKRTDPDVYNLYEKYQKQEKFFDYKTNEALSADKINRFESNLLALLRDRPIDDNLLSIAVAFICKYYVDFSWLTVCYGKEVLEVLKSLTATISLEQCQMLQGLISDYYIYIKQRLKSANKITRNRLHPSNYRREKRRIEVLGGLDKLLCNRSELLLREQQERFNGRCKVIAAVVAFSARRVAAAQKT